MTTEQIIESAPDYCKETARLYVISTDYDDLAPWNVFLDLIGWNQEHFGYAMTSLDEDGFTSLGHREQFQLGKALMEYSESWPLDVRRFIDSLMQESAPTEP